MVNGGMIGKNADHPESPFYRGAANGQTTPILLIIDNSIIANVCVLVNDFCTILMQSKEFVHLHQN